MDAGDGGVGDIEAPLDAATSSLHDLWDAPDGALDDAVVPRGHRRHQLDGDLVIAAETAKCLSCSLGPPGGTKAGHATYM